MNDAMRERLLPWLLVLPTLLFAAPFSPLAEDPYPHLAGAGFALLGLLPLALVLMSGRARLGDGWPFLVLAVWACVVLALARATDLFEARRALLFLALAPLAFAGGSALERHGRARFAWLLVGLSCVWTIQASLAGLGSGSFGGLLGDSGSLSQAALPGAAIGAGWIALRGGRKRLFGGLALAAFLLHVAAAPVLAGGHTLLAALLLAAWRGSARGRPRLAKLALCALITPFAGMAVAEMATGEAPRLEGVAAHSHSLGGLGVRGLVWNASLQMIAAHPLIGAGPGQFQAAFPTARDPREIELSRHGVCEELDTEVEHSHNDWLLAWLELGIPGGLLLALGLTLAARSALAVLGDEERLPLAMAALALLVNAFVHAPLSANAASAPLAFALFGCLGRPGPATRRAALAAALPVLVAAPFAPALVQHGRISSDYVRATRHLLGLLSEPETPLREVQLASASARVQDLLGSARSGGLVSAPLLALAARVAAGDERAALWEELLRIRPSSVEAWEQSATENARRGNTEEAHRRYREARALSPTHPRILRNSVRLECTQGDLELGLALLAQLRSQGCLDPLWLADLGQELVLDLGLPERGARVLMAQALEELSAETLHASARDEGPGADANECLAQLIWAREHAAREDWELALRNYRQARDRSRRRRPAGAPLYSMELAAAELRAQRREDAAQHLDGVLRGRALDGLTWAELPGWARDTLLQYGLTAPGSP